VIGISADESSAALTGVIQTILDGMAPFVGSAAAALRRPTPPIEVDARFVGEGYGIPTPASTEALELTARCEGLFLDPTYTAKAMAGLIASVRDGRLRDCRSILFWHTGGQVGLFA
jgi:L-cysteate sulfo-lyase